MKIKNTCLQIAAILLLNGCFSDSLSLPDSEQLKQPAEYINTHQATDKYTTAITKSRALLVPLLEQYPGISVSVGVGPDIVWSEGLGFADLALQQPVQSSTKFRYYSLSKFVTGVMAARLIEQGKLQLSDPVKRFLPDLPSSYNDVKVGELLSHTAGVRHYKPDEWMQMSTQPSESLALDLQRFINDSLVAQPGAAFKYSSFSYVLLSGVLQSAAKAPFHDIVEKQILKRKSNKYSDSQYYQEAFFSDVEVAQTIDNASKWGGGSITGTADEYTRFCLSVLAGQVISHEQTKTLFKPLMLSTGKATSYGFGMFVGIDDETGDAYGAHSGSGLGGRSAMVILPDRKVVVTILANIESESLLETAGKIAAQFR